MIQKIAKMVSFFTAGSREKETILGAAHTNIWPFLFCQSFRSLKAGLCDEKLSLMPCLRTFSNV